MRPVAVPAHLPDGGGGAGAVCAGVGLAGAAPPRPGARALRGACSASAPRPGPTCCNARCPAPEAPLERAGGGAARMVAAPARADGAGRRPGPAAGHERVFARREAEPGPMFRAGCSRCRWTTGAPCGCCAALRGMRRAGLAGCPARPDVAGAPPPPPPPWWAPRPGPTGSPGGAAAVLFAAVAGAPGRWCGG
jgi:hypothetical protein